MLLVNYYLDTLLMESDKNQGEVIVPPYKNWMIYRHPGSSMHLFTHFNGKPCEDLWKNSRETRCRSCNIELPDDVRNHLFKVYRFIRN